MHHTGISENLAVLPLALFSFPSLIFNKSIIPTTKTSTPKLKMILSATMARITPTIFDSVSARINTNKESSKTKECRNEINEASVPIFNALLSPFEYICSLGDGIVLNTLLETELF